MEPAPPGEGCLTTAVRIPVRIVVLVLVVPVRMAWDAVVASAAVVWRTVLRPFGAGLAWLGRTLVVAPLSWVYGHVLAPAGRGAAWLLRAVGAGVVWLLRAVGAGAAWLLRAVGAGVAWLVVTPARALYGYVLAPLGRGLRRLALGAAAVLAATAFAVGTAARRLWRYAVVKPLTWVYRRVLTPPGRAAAWLLRTLAAGAVWLVVTPAKALYGYVLAPLGRGLLRLVRAARAGLGAGARGLYGYVLAPAAHSLGIALAWPFVALWRYVLLPAGRLTAAAVRVVARELAGALGHAWRVAGYLSRAAGRGVARLVRWVVVDPCRWLWVRAVLPLWRPVGRALRLVRDTVYRPAVAAAREAVRQARATARQARADLRRALFGAPKQVTRDTGPSYPQGAAHEEHQAAPARTLGSSTTALSKD